MSYMAAGRRPRKGDERDPGLTAAGDGVPHSTEEMVANHSGVWVGSAAYGATAATGRG